MVGRPKKTEEQEALLRRFGQNFKAAREAAGVTQEALARILEVGSNYVQDVERGDVNISVTRLLEITEALECSPNDLLV